MRNCGINYEDVSIIDMLPDPEVISLLKRSEADFANGDKLSAMLNLKFAFHKIERPDGKVLPFLKAPKEPNVPNEFRKFGADKYFRQLHFFLEECATTTNSMIMKIDRLQYAAYSREGPYIVWTMDGRAHVHLRDDYESLTRDLYEKWRTFVIDYAFKAVDAYVPQGYDHAPREYFIRKEE